MSIVTVIDQNTDREVPAACITSDSFTATIAPWFKADNEDPGKLDASIREEFLDLAKIIQSGAAWTDEEAGELARFLGLTVLFGEVEIDLHPADNPSLVDPEDFTGETKWWDTLVVNAPGSGHEIARVYVESSEDAAPYNDALTSAGFDHFRFSTF